jgi:enoyl-CoA hydratase
MSFETLDVTVSDKVAHVVLNRPKALNTMTRAFWSEIRDAFADLDGNPDVRAVVLSSTGKHFTAGMDLSVFGSLQPDGNADGATRREALRRTVFEFQESFSPIERMRVPVLAAIQGGCIGGGVDLISTTDMRYCTRNAFFTIMEINIGLTADVGTLQRLPHLMPAGLMRELAYTGRKMKAEEAKDAGLVNQIYDSHDEMLEDVTGIAREIASKAPLAVTGTKEMLNYARDHSVEDGLRYVATWQAAMLSSGDMMEAMQARRDKRDAEFSDLLGKASTN